MPNDFIQIEVKGLDKVIAALDKFPRKVASYMQQAGKESSDRVILPTQGLKRYPPATAANQPPTPYYIRGRGTQYKYGNKGESERYGTQWHTEKRDYMDTLIGNRASYAKYLGGDEQAHFMAPKGWRKLFDVAKEKLPQIKKVYDAWVGKLIKDLGL